MGESTDTIRVLHVDDDPDFAKVAATFLEREDGPFDVDIATTAEDGLDRLDTREYDCVVSDYDMPGRNGIEFLEAVRETYPDLPFILFTGEGSETIASDAISAGVSDYLRKASGTDQYALLANRIRNSVSKFRAERALEENRDRVTFALDATDSIIFEVDLETGNETRHGPFERLFGIESAEIPTNSEFYDACVHPEDRDRIRSLQHPETLAECEDTITYEFRTHPDLGPVRWIEAEMYVETGPDGEPARLIGLDSDVTERKEREQSLREKSNLLDQLFEQIPTHLYVMDEEARLLWVSEYYVDDPEERIGKTDREIAPGEFGEEAHADNVEVIETGEPLINKEEYLSSRDKWGLTSKVPWYDEDGEIAGLIGVTRDITKRKEYEQELADQNEGLATFASVVSHDLRNPLNVAEGRLKLAREDCRSDHLDDAIDAIDRCETIVEDLLTLAREGKEVGEIEPVSLRRVAEDCWGNVETGTATLAVDTDRAVRADRSRLQQLLENLLRNAIEHGGDGVTVTMGDLPDGFYVADDGAGLPEIERDRVFEAGNSMTDGSTGLGLAIVNQIVEAHGWTITIEESEGGGARFEITGVEHTE